MICSIIFQSKSLVLRSSNSSFLVIMIWAFRFIIICFSNVEVEYHREHTECQCNWRNKHNNVFIQEYKYIYAYINIWVFLTLFFSYTKKKVEYLRVCVVHVCNKMEHIYGRNTGLGEQPLISCCFHFSWLKGRNAPKWSDQ